MKLSKNRSKEYLLIQQTAARNARHNILNKSIVLIACLVALAAAIPTSQAQLSYVITDLGMLPGTYGSSARGINDSGTVVGSSDTHSGVGIGWVYDSTGMHDLQTMTGHEVATAIAINNAGTIVGDYSWYHYSGIKIDSTGATDLGPVMGGGASSAYGISDSGVIVGYNQQNNRFDYHRTAIEIDASGNPHNLAALPGAEWGASAFGINNAGTIIVGESSFKTNPNGISHAVMWDSNGIHDLGSLPGRSLSQASDVNNAGTVVGFSWNDVVGNYLPFVTDANGNIKELGLLPGKSQAFAEAINNAGTIVGTALNDWSDATVFVTDSQGEMQDLSSLLTPESKSLFSVLSGGDINNNGQIVGSGQTPSGEWHAFLATPVPEPSTWAMLVGGMFSLLMVRRRR